MVHTTGVQTHINLGTFVLEAFSQRLGFQGGGFGVPVLPHGQMEIYEIIFHLANDSHAQSCRVVEFSLYYSFKFSRQAHEPQTTQLRPDSNNLTGNIDDEKNPKKNNVYIADSEPPPT